MTRCVWIVNQYGSTPETGVGGRHFYLAKELAKKGHKVYLIASSSHHLLRKKKVFNERFYVEHVDGFNMVWVNMPVYEEAHSKQRALNWFLFPWRIQNLTRYIPDKPDTVLCSSPSLISLLGAQRLAKKFKARLVFEVRDIWPLTLTEIGGYSSKHPFIRFMQWVEDKAYQNSDAVISNLKNAVEHMVSRGMDESKFNWIPNGFSLDEVTQKVALNQQALDRIPTDKFIVGYAGTLGTANAIDTLIEAAEQLRDNTDIAFLLVGAGKEKKALQQVVTDKDLINVIFIDPIPKIEIQAMLNHFDICYIGLTKDPLFRFGVSPNKLFDYFYSAKPIIYGIESGNYRPVEEVGAGVQIPAQDSVALSFAVKKLYSMESGKRIEMGEKGHALALARYQYSELATALEQVLFCND